MDTLSKLLICVLFYFGRSSSWWVFYSRFTIKIFHSFSGFFQHGSGSSVNAIMSLSSALLLAISLKIFWFLIALLLQFYPKSAILGLSFLDPKDICLPNQFSRRSWQNRYVSAYLTWCQRRNLASMVELVLTVCLPQYNHFLARIFCKVSLALLNIIQQILERLN